MADIIKLLPDHVANQIAAGEVVQRPASVVKELLENAIDAGAATIKLIIKDSGKTLIQVIDDGKGMSPTDARLSFERHATSKIKNAEDLFALHTKGFRGEALASIAAVAHVDLKTRQQGEDVGSCIEIEGSIIKSQDIVATPAGTSIAVKNLFFNIPARRNFLKSDSVEMRHIIDEFHRVALAHEQITFVMYHNEGELFNLPQSNKRQRIVNVFGSKTNEKLVPVEEETGIVKIKGFIIKPEFAKKTKGEQYFFVNDRFIKHSYLHHAVASAFDGLLPDRARASYFLYLEVDPQTIDINIHPTKTEVKFEDEHSIYTLLRAAVKHSLGQFNIAPVLDFDREPGLDTPYAYKHRQAETPQVEVDRDFNPFKENNTGRISVSSRVHYEKKSAAGWENLYAGLDNHGGRADDSFSRVEIESEDPAGGMFDEGGASAEANCYQLHNKFLVGTIKSGMVIIDQNKAHQRILYEDLLKNITVKESVSQQLLFPLRFDFSKKEIHLLLQLKETLENTGFIFDAVDDDTLEITGLPMGMGENESHRVLEQLLADVEREVPGAGFSQVDLLARSMAGSMAIRNGEKLDAASCEYLLNKLFACKEPMLSPFNRPTFVTISVEELERKFETR